MSFRFIVLLTVKKIFYTIQNRIIDSEKVVTCKSSVIMNSHYLVVVFFFHLSDKKLEDGYKADKDCEWKQPKKKDETFQYAYGEQPTDKEKKSKPNLKVGNVRQKIQAQRKREELQLHEIKPKQKVVSDTQRQRGVNLGFPYKFKQQQKEETRACLQDQLKEKYEGIDEVQKELQKKEQEVQKTNLKKMETQLRELQGQLREKSAQEAALLEQLRAEQQQVTELQGQLRAREKAASTMQQELSNLRSEVEEKDRNMAALQERSRVEQQQQVTALLSALTTRGEEARTMKQQMSNLQCELEEKDTNTANLQERLGAEQQQVTELQNQIGTNEEEIRTMRQQLDNLHGQLLQKNADMSTLQRKEERRFIELQRLFQEVRTMRVQLANLPDHKQQIQVKQQQVRELQSQLTEQEQEIRTSRKQITEFQGQGERLRMEQERVSELQSQLTTKEQEVRTLRQQITDFQGQGEWLRMEQERVSELQSQNEQQILELSQQITVLRERVEQLRVEIGEIESRPDWAINRAEIKMTNQELGRGAWAVVTQGEYCGIAVAVKQIHDEIISLDFLNLFKREMNIAPKCRHPCLLQFIGATNDEGSPLFVTELMETSLRGLLEQRQLSETEISVISLDVARALYYLHEKKPEPIIHRDVSSANVLLWRQGDQWRGKVSDYGTANFMLKTKTVAPGASSYSAPEALTINQTEKVGNH